MDVAHGLFSSIVSDALGVPRETLLVDGKKPADINEGIPIAYVDNFVFLGASSQQVSCAVRLVRRRCSQLGLPTHEVQSSTRKLTVLGWEIDGARRVLRPSPRRAWRLFFALDQALHLGRLSSKELERLVGHFTFVALARRCSLSVMGAVYSYIKRGMSGLADCGRLSRGNLRG